MLLMKIDWNQPLTFQLPPDTKYTTHGWLVLDLPIANFNADQIAKYKIVQLTDPQVIAEFAHINYTVLDDGCVALVTTVADHNPESIAEGHMHHFPTLTSAEDIDLFLKGYKYLSCLEIQAEFDVKFSNMRSMTSKLEASTHQQQLEESQAVQANPNYPTPLLSALSAASGISVGELASQALAKNAAFQAQQATLLGEMMAEKKAVNDCTTPLQVKQLGWI
jgi:hypothetical protein